MEEDIQNKQAYLRENVLEKGYDADEFMAFLQEKKGENGLDLNTWTMKELTKAVADFINDKDKENEQEDEINTNMNKIEEVSEENILSQRESMSISNNNNTNNIIKNDNEEINTNSNINDIKENINENIIEIKSNDKFGKCQISEVTAISNANGVRVKLSSPQKIDGHIFSKSFIQYTVETEPFGYKTNKRYNDFSWLSKTLSLIYSNCVLPPLCKKHLGHRFGDALIAKRMRSIEKFMQGIIEHPLIKNSELLNDFLSAKTRDEYNKKIKKYQKIKNPPSYIRELKTLDGQVNIEITKEKEIYFDNIKNYAKSNYHLLQKITKSYKSLLNLMQQMADKMKDISLLWKQVLDISIKYYDSHNTSETFNIMSKFMESWAEIQRKQSSIMNENIREYFRYVKNEFFNLKEMAIKVKNCRVQYTKAQEKLLNTKESLFQKQDIELWQLRAEDKANRIQLLSDKNFAFSKMLPQETMKVYEYKTFYGGMLNSIIIEFERIRKINAKRHKENITNFIRLLSNECTNLHITLADRLSEFNELRDDADTNDIGRSMSLKKVENLMDNQNEENEENDNGDENNHEDNNEIKINSEKGEKKDNKSLGFDFEIVDEGDVVNGKNENKKEEENKINDNKKEDNKKEEKKKTDKKSKKDSKKK